jgi:RNA polymerase sigma-70 factor, ECF subfamily
VATNLCLNHLSRHRSRWRLFSELQREDADEGTSIEDTLPASLDDADADAVERADEEARLERALRDLPDHQRVPIVLFHFEDKSYQEIAGLLGISLAKLKTDIHRGREALRRVLSETHGSH